MTGNNNINQYIDKKPFETVQELKEEYQIPSLEEFMETYERNDNLNYDDLKGGDIGTLKGYGPGLWEREEMIMRNWEKGEESRKRHEKEREEKKYKGLCLKDDCWERRRHGDNEYCGKHREEYEDKVRFTKWMGKTALGIGASTLLGSVGSLAVGGAGWLGGKIGEAASTSEDDKEAWKIIGDFGWDLVEGEVIGKVGGKVADKLISSGKEVADIALTYGTPTGQFTAHEIHKANGVDYNPHCKICKQ